MAKVCGLDFSGLVKPGEETYYVPIQKITVGCLLKTAEEHCEECGHRERCGECCIHTAIERAKWSMQVDPCFDGDFNIVKGDRRRKSEAEV